MTSEFTIAVHAMVYLDHKGTTISSEALAENVCTNPARIRKVMAKLKKARLIGTKEGQSGGYHAGENAADVTLLQICGALGEEAVCCTWHSGSSDMKCLVASGMAGIMDDIYGKMNEACKEELAGITVGDIEQRIFRKEPVNQSSEG